MSKLIDVPSANAEKPHKVYADATGNPSKQALIFVHGLACSTGAFDAIFQHEEFLQNFYLIRYDMRGHGQSGKPDTAEGYTSELYAQDFAAVIKAFDVQKPIIVGWSMGGTVAVDVANHLPEGTVSGVISLTGLAYNSPHAHGLMGLPDLLETIPTLLQPDSFLAGKNAAEKFVDICTVSPLPYATKCSWVGGVLLQTSEDRLFVLGREQDGPGGLKKLADQGVPLLCIYGEKDLQMNGSALVTELSTYYQQPDVFTPETGYTPSDKLFHVMKIPGAGHAVFLEESGGKRHVDIISSTVSAWAAKKVSKK